MSLQVLLVDDDKAVREALGQTLDLAGLEPVAVGSYIEAKDYIRPEFDGVVVSDIRMPGKDGFELLEHSRKTDPELPVILLTGEGDIPMAVRGMRAGAFAFLEKPCSPKDFLRTVEKALKARALVLENRSLKRQLQNGDAAARLLFGQSDLSEALRNRVRAVARSGAEILITGEPGTGTAKVAEVIHQLSGPASRPFVKRVGAGLSGGALAMAFDEAKGGTVFLDEVAAISPDVQYALLDLLEAGPGVRVIAGTYHDLQRDVGAGRFNPDLFYKLDVMRVRIPSLRERPEDIPVLFRHYVAIACEQAALPEPDIPQDVLARMMAQDWPGNARALMNAAMRFAMGLSEGDAEGQGLGLAEQMAQVERTLLIDALRRLRGNASEAARQLKLPRKTFYDKLTKHRIRAEDYR